ncbi:hypothetical protein E7T06_15170 [Deinococcus sp. Arct2-2]|uniref:hypothetical protein n=1 Tax=Deinococcus sp. Arct2-2 TaxID=2568653 RepID=UPI0010A2F7F0|nr:hypothetical protein [Deinococcus sp. Arct2-2]THF68707.1 hypothetical protein E7T06_15170 [Deinococcus sp. Arct2-2]
MMQITHVFHMFIGVLALATSAQAQDSSPPAPQTYTVTLGSGQNVMVTAPAATPHPDSGWITWQFERKAASPDGRFVAVIFLKDAVFAKDNVTVVYLVKPGGQILPLPDSDVNILNWTPDGQYLLGGGVNTLRLWNTNGKVRTRVLDSIGALDTTGNFACVSPLSFDEAAVTVQRFSLPQLRPAGTFVLPAAPAEDERFCR